MTDIYVAVWNVPTGSMSWYTQGFGSKLDYLEDVVKAAKQKIDALHKEEYDGLWLFVAPEFTFMSFDMADRVHSQELDVANLKVRCESLTKTFEGLLLIPGSIAYKKKLYQRIRYQDDPRLEKKTTFVEHQPAYLEAIQRIDQFFTARSEHMKNVYGLGNQLTKQVKKETNKTKKKSLRQYLDKVTKTREKQLKFELNRYNPKSSLGTKHQKQKVQLIVKGYLVRNVAYGYYKGVKRFAFKKRTNIEIDEGFKHNMIYDVGTGDAVWDWEGLTVGLEICADAGLGLLNYKKKSTDIYIVIAESMDLGHLHSPPYSLRIFVDSSRECDLHAKGKASMKTKPKEFKLKFGLLSVGKVQWK